MRVDWVTTVDIVGSLSPIYAWLCRARILITFHFLPGHPGAARSPLLFRHTEPIVTRLHTACVRKHARHRGEAHPSFLTRLRSLALLSACERVQLAAIARRAELHTIPGWMDAPRNCLRSIYGVVDGFVSWRNVELCANHYAEPIFFSLVSRRNTVIFLYSFPRLISNNPVFIRLFWGKRFSRDPRIANVNIIKIDLW